MFYITGDTHADFDFLKSFCMSNTTSLDDHLIILGDSGINYFDEFQSIKIKQYITKQPITLVCIQGNHEERAENIKTYREQQLFENTVLVEPQYPNIIFLKSGNIYNIKGKSVLVLGGAYSVDKQWRLTVGEKWFESEQLTATERSEILKAVRDKHFDIILSHTCPYSYQPHDTFKYDLIGVDTTMEQFLDSIAINTSYDDWYCGHFHIDRDVDNIHFRMNIIDTLEL